MARREMYSPDIPTEQQDSRSGRRVGPAMIRVWLRSAPANDRLIYALGARPPAEAVDEVRKLSRLGLVRPHNTRINGAPVYVLVKLASFADLGIAES